MEIDFSKRRICVGWPSPELVDYRFIASLNDLFIQSAQFVPVGTTNAVSSRVAVNRNIIVENARQLQATDILWIDADSVFPVNGLLRLLQHDKDIVCATTCRRKGNDRSPVALPLDPANIQPYQKLVKMKLVGFPFMLTKMGVFDKLEKPYFAEPPRRMTDIDTGNDDVVGEDEYFCSNALKAGYDIWCDMELSMEIGHVGSEVYYIQQPQSVAQAARATIDLALGSIETQSDEQSARSRDMVGE